MDESRHKALVVGGLAQMQAGDLSGADDAFAQALALNPHDWQAWLQRASIALLRAQPQAGLQFAQRAYELERRDADVLKILGAAHAECGDMNAALAWYRKGLKLKPAAAGLHFNLAKALMATGDMDGALLAYRRAHAIEPDWPDAMVNYSNLLRELGRAAEALPLLDRARAGNPRSDMLSLARVDVLLEMHGPAAALAACRERLAAFPDDLATAARFSDLLLGAGEFREGWTEYKRRERSAPPDGSKEPLPERLDGVALTLLHEQGLGDVLFFLRFARALRARGARLALAAPRKLHGILAGFPALEHVIDPDQRLPEGRRLRLGDLPALLGSDRAEPSIALAPRPDLVQQWRARLAGLGPPPYLGVTWRAGTEPFSRPEFAHPLASLYKEIPLGLLGRALAGTRGTCLVLQRLPKGGEVAVFSAALGRAAHDLSALNEDLEQMLAVLDLIDDYAGVSNTNMHLRAAAGRTAKVLVPYPPEWRWMNEGNESPWFPGFRVYRQADRLSWSEPLAQLARDL